MDPKQIATVAKCRIEGMSHRDIAPLIGVSDRTVGRTLQKPEIKALIEREASEIINRGLKQARRTITRLAAIGNAKGQDKDMLKLSLDASKHITSMAGLSGQAPSTIINAMIQVNAAPEQAQELTDIHAFLAHKWEAGAIDTECAEVEQVDSQECSQNEQCAIVEQGEMISVRDSHTSPQDPKPASRASRSKAYSKRKVDNPVDNSGCQPQGRVIDI